MRGTTRKRRAAVVCALAAVVSIFDPGLAHAHDAGAAVEPVLIGDLRSEVTTRVLPAGVEAQLLENGYALRLVNRSARDVTAGAGGEGPGGHRSPAARLTVAAGDTALWRGAPSAVTHADRHAARGAGDGDQVRSWSIVLTSIDGSNYQLRGVIRKVAPPSAAWLLAGVPAILLLLGLAIALRSAGMVVRGGLLAVAVVCFAAETVTLVAARAAGEGWPAMTLEYLPQLGVCLLGVAACVPVRRDHQLADLLPAITLLGIGAGCVPRWPVLWSPVVVTDLPVPVDRFLVLAISGAALSSMALVLLGRRSAGAPPG